MKHTLPPLGDLFSEASYLMRKNFRGLVTLVIPRAVLPMVVLGITLCLSVSLDKWVLALLLLLEAPTLIVLSVQLAPKLIEFNLATAEGRQIDPDAPGAWPWLGSFLLWAGPFEVFHWIIRIVGGIGLGLLTSLLAIYPSSRLRVRGIVTVGEGTVTRAPSRSWELTEGVGWRLYFYSLIVTLPALIFTAILIVVLVLVMLSNVHPWNKALLKENVPVIIGAACFGVLPLILYAAFCLSYFDVLVYLTLVEQEQTFNDTIEQLDGSL